MERDLQPNVRNYTRAMLFRDPDWIPTSVSIMPATWMKHGEAVEEIVLEHPRLFPGYLAGDFRHMSLTRQYRAGRWTDRWGTTWLNIEEGLDSLPLDAEAPLRDWAALRGYCPPDPLADDGWTDTPIDWNARAVEVTEARSHGKLGAGHLAHGFMFMRLHYLRGYVNLMLDIANHEPALDRLADVVRSYAVSLVTKWLQLGVEIVHGGDDMGTQRSLPIHPDDWRRYLKPAYRAIVAPCAEQGIYFYLHSDGHILEIIPDLVDCGVTVINPQIRANGLEGLRRVARGNVCINLDLDRQLFPFASPDEIRRHIRGAVEALSTPRGGLMLHAECEPDVPLPSIRAIVEALEACGGGPA